MRTVSFEENAPQKLIVDFRGKGMSSGCLEAGDIKARAVPVQATLASLALIPGLGYQGGLSRARQAGKPDQ